MKLSYPKWNILTVCPEDCISVLCIENRRLFGDYVYALGRQVDTKDGEFFLSDNDESLDLSDSLELITDPFRLDFKSKKFQSALLKSLEKIANEEEYAELMSLIVNTQNFTMTLCNYLDFDIELNRVPECVDFIKSCSPSFSYDGSGLLGSLTDYMLLCQSVLNKYLIVTVNLHDYLSAEDLLLLYNTLINKHLRLLMLETHAWPLLPCETWQIIDSDLCEI